MVVVACFVLSSERRIGVVSRLVMRLVGGVVPWWLAGLANWGNVVVPVRVVAVVVVASSVNVVVPVPVVGAMVVLAVSLRVSERKRCGIASGVAAKRCPGGVVGHGGHVRTVGTGRAVGVRA